MAVYFDYQILPDDDHIFTHVQWHRNYPLLAAALKNETEKKGCICFYLDEVCSKQPSSRVILSDL